jgi:membrane protein DedA with SNARE-associated domain
LFHKLIDALVAYGPYGLLVLSFVDSVGIGRRFLAQSQKPGRAHKFRLWFERYGLITIFIPALLPIPMPLKLFVASAGALGTKMRHFLGVVTLARILRFGGAAWLGVVVGESSAGFLKAHTWHFLAAAVALFLALYLLVRLNDHWRGRSALLT